MHYCPWDELAPRKRNGQSLYGKERSHLFTGRVIMSTPKLFYKESWKVPDNLIPFLFENAFNKSITVSTKTLGLVRYGKGKKLVISKPEDNYS
jgi:hypothetical protein